MICLCIIMCKFWGTFKKCWFGFGITCLNRHCTRKLSIAGLGFTNSDFIVAEKVLFFILENDIMDIFRVCTLVIKTKDQFAPFSFYGYCVIMALWLVVKRTFLLFYSAFGVGCNNVA